MAGVSKSIFNISSGEKPTPQRLDGGRLTPIDGGQVHINHRSTFHQLLSPIHPPRKIRQESTGFEQCHRETVRAGCLPRAREHRALKPRCCITSLPITSPLWLLAPLGAGREPGGVEAGRFSPGFREKPCTKGSLPADLARLREGTSGQE